MKIIYSLSNMLRFCLTSALFLLMLTGCTEEVFIEPKLYGSISGQVLTLDGKQPLENVLVRISPSGKNITPDSAGNFRVDSLPVGKYSIQTTVDKYKTDLASVDVEENKTTTVSVFLILDNNQNKAPLMPTVVKPAHNAQDVALSTVLAWKTTDPDKDSLRYSVILFKEGQPTTVPVASGLHADTLVVNNLEYATTYYWQVITTDSINKPVYSEVWSFKTRPIPDHAYIFSRQVNQNYQIFSSNGTETIQLTTLGGNWRPVVSPNREKVAFISNVNTDPHIYISNRVGKELKRVTVVPIAGVALMDLSFCWSPNGLEILYPYYDKLYAVHTDGSGLRVVAEAPTGRFFAGCDWTAQGNKIIARVTGSTVYDNELYMVNPATGVLTKLVTGRPGKMGNPDFSTDGKTALFTLDVSNFQNIEGRQLDSRIFTVDVATGISSDISIGKTRGNNDLDARFSPNGARIIFTNTSNDGFSEKSLFSMDLSGENRVEILKNAEMPYWR
ncbi:MAG TPA: carboxypeptidase regulatory-like domain-containing protein [Dyadobacter sp.]|nr:carboxypeptidase regulatory-like domain-containing protein [Dyadobacter sp.]